MFMHFHDMFTDFYATGGFDRIIFDEFGNRCDEEPKIIDVVNYAEVEPTNACLFTAN